MTTLQELAVGDRVVARHVLEVDDNGKIFDIPAGTPGYVKARTKGALATEVKFIGARTRVWLDDDTLVERAHRNGNGNG